MSGASTQAMVTSTLRAAILTGEFVPGQRLVEADLTSRLHVGRSIVREALADLDREGLIERVAHRGARVRTPDTVEAVEVTEVAVLVEGFCASKAAQRITDEQITGLRRLADELRVASEAADVLGYSALEQRLHDRLRDIAAQPIATDVSERLRARNARHRFRLALRPGHPQTSLPDQLAVIDEVCARSPDGAERAVRRRYRTILQALTEQT